VTRNRRRTGRKTRSRATLIIVVGLFLLAVVIADEMGLTNHS
jgi:hypothetical protein